MIRRLILARQSYTQLLTVMFGSLFGLFMVMASIQLFFDFKTILSGTDDLLSSQVMVLNKNVNILNTITGSGNTFSESDIEEIKKMPTVEQVGTFKANRFKAKTAFEFMGNAVYTDIFFESVPDRFLDVKADNWKWREGDAVPIILPADYLNLYNFGFAPSQGLRQISREMAQMAPLKVKVIGRGQELTLPGRIVGFTNRINSIIVPEKFLDYANERYGDAPDNGSSRLILTSSDPSNTELLKHIEDSGYETNPELLKSGRINALLKLILGIVLSVGGVIIILSVLGFIQYSQLLVNHARYEIKTLLELGYYHRTIFMRYMAFYAVILGIISILAFTALYIGKGYFNSMMLEKGYKAGEGIYSSVILYGLGMIVLFMLVNGLNVYRLVRKLASSK